MDLRGKETDWIMWDSSMTEKPAVFNNFFMRQALIVSLLFSRPYYES